MRIAATPQLTVYVTLGHAYLLRLITDGSFDLVTGEGGKIIFVQFIFLGQSRQYFPRFPIVSLHNFRGFLFFNFFTASSFSLDLR